MSVTTLIKFPTGNLLNLDDVAVRTGNTNDPEVTLAAKSKTAVTSAKGADLLEEVARRRSMQNTKMASVNVVTIEGVDASVALLPMEDDKGALPVRWRKGGATAGIDLKKYLAVRPFTVPVGSRAHIPVSIGEVAGFGLCLLVHFGQAEYRAVEKAEKKAKASDSKGGKSTNSKSQAEPQEEKAVEAQAHEDVAAAATPQS